MTAEQAIGWTLKQVSALTAIASTRIYHGLRPVGTTVPAVNFYRLAGGQRNPGMDSATFSINCRAATAETALQMARIVVDTFHGTSGTGTYGTAPATGATTFAIARASLRQDQGLIPEPEDSLYNAPVDIFAVWPSTTAS